VFLEARKTKKKIKKIICIQISIVPVNGNQTRKKSEQSEYALGGYVQTHCTHILLYPKQG